MPAAAVVAIVILASAGIFWRQSIQRATTYDVIVVGAGPGGIAASIQAARMGEHVALLERTDWVGGQMTAAAVGTMDEGDSIDARKSGIYHEFVQAATKLYAGKKHSDSTCYYSPSSLCVDPRDGQAILRQMLNKEASHLTLKTGVQVSAVVKQGNDVTGLVANGVHYTSKVVIDADEYGDVLAQAGAAYRLGNGTSTSPSTNSCVQSITYSAIMKYYQNGVPKNLQFTSPPPGYTSALKKHFAGIISNSGTDFMATKKLPSTFRSYAAWRGLPDLTSPKNYNVLQHGNGIARTALNLGNDFPLKGNLSTSFISDPSARLQDICEAKMLTLQLAYYIQHDLHQTHWSLADDEGYDTSYNRQHHCAGLSNYTAFEDQMPEEPYVREARRLVGVETLTGALLNERPWKNASQIPRYADSIAVGYYATDLHACRQPSDLEQGLDSPSYLSQAPQAGPFEVPMGTLIPIKVDGLLAAEKNISASRLAEGAIREQPIAMDTGQAAGALAALAVQQHRQPRAVPASDVQAVLIRAHEVIKVKS
ncbi:MAG: FAD-dependent oxidoreductase [Candidatus Saccharibacteria bacterium]